MSAYMVNTEHITAILTAGMIFSGPARRLTWYVNPAVADTVEGVNAALLPEGAETTGYSTGDAWGDLTGVQHRRRELSCETADHWGAVLLGENRRSVDHRYNESEIEELYQFPGFGPWTRDPLTPVEVLKAIDGYEYQACEHPEFWRSEAKALCDKIRSTTIGGLPGYNEAGTWCVSHASWGR